MDDDPSMHDTPRPSEAAMTPQRKRIELDPVPDQAATLTKMLATAHAAGAHAAIPLFKCEACRAMPDYHARRKAAEAPVELARAIQKDIDAIIGPMPANPTNVRPRRSTMRHVPPVVEQAAIQRPSPSEALQADLEPLPIAYSHIFPRWPTREAWLLAGVEAMTPWITEVGAVMPSVRVSIGWPGGRGAKAGVRGQCWSGTTVADGQPAIFITPDQHEPDVILAILLHEMDHAVGNFGHKGEFAKLAGKLGLTKPWITATPSAPLAEKIAALAAKLGPFPHSKVNPGHGLAGTGPSRPPVQGTRMLKLVCPVDGYTVRTTRRWIEFGLPWCPGDPAMRHGGDWYDAIHEMEEVTK